MYYKVVNTESEVYKKLHAMRTEELKMDAENEIAIDKKIGLVRGDLFFGKKGQRHFNRTTQYDGFEFIHPEKVDLKIWKKHKVHEKIFVPNRRTKVGKEMADFLLNGLQSNNFMEPLDILGISINNSLQFPYVEISEEAIILFLGNFVIPQDPNVIEITRTEFNLYLKKVN